MGKYIRKCRGGGTTEAAASAVVVAVVRTRSRSAAAAAPAPVPKRARKQAAPTRAEAGAVDMGRDEHGDDGGEAGKGCCYLQLRSRTLFMVAAEVDASPREEPVPVAAPEEVEEEASSVVSVAGVSRCSSTAASSSSVDVATTLRTRNGCTAEAREDCGEESSVSDSGSGPQPQEWREATPSSRALGDDDLSDQESSKASDDDPNKQHHRRQPSSAAATTTAVRSCRATRTTMPRQEEIEEFFAAAEKAEAERFAERYNFDVVRGLPLDAGGQLEWTPVGSG